MKIPENMDSTDLCDAPTEDDVRHSIRQWLEEPPEDFDAADFFEGYIDPEGPFRWCGSTDAWDGIWLLVERDPCLIADALRKWQKECC